MIGNNKNFPKIEKLVKKIGKEFELLVYPIDFYKDKDIISMSLIGSCFLGIDKNQFSVVESMLEKCGIFTGSHILAELLIFFYDKNWSDRDVIRTLFHKYVQAGFAEDFYLVNIPLFYKVIEHELSEHLVIKRQELFEGSCLTSEHINGSFLLNVNWWYNKKHIVDYYKALDKKQLLFDKTYIQKKRFIQQAEKYNLLFKELDIIMHGSLTEFKQLLQSSDFPVQLFHTFFTIDKLQAFLEHQIKTGGNISISDLSDAWLNLDPEFLIMIFVNYQDVITTPYILSVLCSLFSERSLKRLYFSKHPVFKAVAKRLLLD